MNKEQKQYKLPPRSPRDATPWFFKIVRSIKGSQPTQQLQLPEEDANPFMKLNAVLRDVDKVLEARRLNQEAQLDWGQSIQYFQQRAVASCKELELVSQSQAKCVDTAQTLIREAIQALVKIYRDEQVKKLVEQQKAKVEAAKRQREQRLQRDPKAGEERGHQQVEDQIEERREQIQAQENTVSLESTEQVIFQLSQLLQQFNQEALRQEDMTVLITENAEESVFNITDANKELTEAKEYQKGSTSMFTIIFLTLTAIMWLWEYYNTIHLNK